MHSQSIKNQILNTIPNSSIISSTSHSGAYNSIEYSKNPFINPNTKTITPSIGEYFNISFQINNHIITIYRDFPNQPIQLFIDFLDPQQSTLYSNYNNPQQIINLLNQFNNN